MRPASWSAACSVSLMLPSVSSPLVGPASGDRGLKKSRRDGQAGDAPNCPPDAANGGLRPKFAGGVLFDDVVHLRRNQASARDASANPARHRRPGRPLRIRKSSPRVAGGINREYSGFIKIDGPTCGRSATPAPSFGAVQENFSSAVHPRQHPLGWPPRPDAGRCHPRGAPGGAENSSSRCPRVRDPHRGRLAQPSGGQRQRPASRARSSPIRASYSWTRRTVPSTRNRRPW